MKMHYDIIICGAGLSGRLLAYYFVKAKTSKKILMIDKSFKQSDVLLGYWESGAGEFDFLLENKSRTLETRDIKGVSIHPLTKYIYKYIYKNKLFEYIDSQIHDKVDFLEATVTSVVENDSNVIVTTKNKEYIADKVYSSIIQRISDYKSLFANFQHYRGYEVEMDKKIETPTFMDFSICNANQFRFGYILPLKSSRYFIHIVDYKKLPSKSELITYIEKTLGIADYKITREEVGRATLSVQRNKLDTLKIKYIGSAGGVLNSATGYGFVPFIVDAKCFARDLKRDETPLRFKFFFFWMILFINIAPNFAKWLFMRINRINNFDVLLDFVDAKGGWKSISAVLRAVLVSRES